MRKIIVHHSNSLSIGGTEKMLQNMMEYFVKDSTFNHVVAYRASSDRIREEYFKEIMGENKLIPYSSNPAFIEILRKVQPTILHHYAAGIAEFPMIPVVQDILKDTKFVQTAVFGNSNDTIRLDKIIFVSRHIQYLVNKFDDNCCIIRNAVKPKQNDEDLREKLGISEDTFVFGHIGRPDSNTFSNLNLQAYKKIENENTLFLWMPNSDLIKDAVSKLGIRYYKLLDAVIDDYELSKFYNTIDVLAHSRADGECCPAVFYEAFAHGKPVISHYSNTFNGHVESTQDAGFIVAPNDVNEYVRIMKSFLDKEVNYEVLSDNAMKRWKHDTLDSQQAEKQLNVYKELLK